MKPAIRTFLSISAQRRYNVKWHKFQFYCMKLSKYFFRSCCEQINTYTVYACRSQWPRGLRRRSSAARLQRLWARILPEAWMFICCECCVLSGRGLCDGLITRPGESYRLWRVLVCDQETSKTRRLKPATGLWKIRPQWGVTPEKQQTLYAYAWYVTFRKLDAHCLLRSSGTKTAFHSEQCHWQWRHPEHSLPDVRQLTVLLPVHFQYWPSSLQVTYVS